jgi:GntR family transcriptional regulator
MDWYVDLETDAPPSRQIVHAILDAVAAGEFAAGSQLPSVRQLAAKALVNHNTVARAYRDLEQMEVVRGQNGLGVFITERGPAIARQARRDATLSAFQRAAREALRAGHETRVLVAFLSKSSVRRTA